MKRYKLIICTAIFILAIASVSVAIDPPHTPDLSVTCANCHNPGITYTYATIDNTPWNEICWNCHDFGASGSKLESDTHSAISTGDDVAKKYWAGTWTNECRRCHDPHTNEQARSYQGAYPTGAWLYTGTIQSSTYNTITVSGSPWAADELVGKTLHPKAGGSFFYMITDNTPNTIVVAGSMYPFIRMAGGTFAISYGKLIRKDFNTGRAIVNSSGVVFDSSPFRTVKFLNSSGPHSGAITGKDTDAATDAICVVCHTQTTHMNIGVAKYGTSFDTKPQYSHYYSDDQPCWNSSCHSPAPKGFAAGCTNCHGYAPVNDATLLNSVAPNGFTLRGSEYANGAGKHYVHFTEQGFGCAYCHDGGGTSGQHNDEVNPVVQVGFDIFGVPGGVYQAPAFSNAVYDLTAGGSTSYVQSGSDRVCSNIYCHSTVQAGDGVGAPTYKSADWDGAAFADCNPCHQASPDTGSHTKHLASYVCNDCHSGNTHINGNIDVTTGAYTSGGAPQNGFGKCSTASCHDDGTGASAVTPTWGQAGGCGACHASEPATGSHTGHLGYTSDIACGNCHDGTIKDSTAPVTHLDGDIDVYDSSSGDLGYTPNKTKNTAYEACDNTVCHGSTSRTWGDTATGDTCGKCHGDSTTGTSESEIAPPNDTNGDTSASDEEVGAHQAHLTAASGISNAVGCTDCHTKPASVFDSGHIDDTLPAELTWSSFVTNAGNLTPSYNFGTGECANIYCHGSKMPKDSTTGADTTPIWNDVDYMSGSPSLAGDCGQCHGAPPTDSSGGSHSGSEALADCAVCHEHLNADGSFSNALLHINGIVEGVSCSGCHGFPPVNNVTLINTPEDSNRDTDFTQGAGAHNTHYNVRGFDDCYICHYGGGPPGSHYTGQEVTMGFDVFGTKGGFYQAPTYSASGYTLVSGDVVNTTVNVSGSYRVCSNIYCHSSAQGVSDPTAAPTYAAPVWDTTFAGPAKCRECHQAGAHTNNTWPDLQSGGHPEHLVYKFNASATCQACHFDSSADGCVVCHERNVASHINNSIDVKYHPAWPRRNDIGGSYSGDTTPGTAYGNCANLYCHSPGTKSSAPYDAPNTTSYTWGGSLAADCTGCHNGDTGASSTMDSGSHGKHITDDDCSKCHKYTVDEGTSRIINTGIYTAPSQTYGHRFHVDGFLTIVFNGASSSGTYNGTSSPIQTRNPGTAYATCSSVSCHNDGTGAMVETPTWGTAGDCATCHASAPSTGSHSPHFTYSQIGCGDCHDGAIKDSSAPSEHVDGDIDVYDVSSGDLGYTPDKTINTAYDSCSNIYCHGDYNGSGLNASPTWNDSASGACGTCHKASNWDSLQSGSHERHISNSNILGGVSKAGYNREYACTLCHDNVTGGSGPSSYTIADKTKHVNEVVDWEFDTTDSRLSASSLYSIANGTVGPTNGTSPRAYGTCTNVYCHSTVQPDGGVGAPTYDSPQWGTTISCSQNCHAPQDLTYMHGTTISTGSHSAHMAVDYGLGSQILDCTICHKWNSAAALDNCNQCHGSLDEKAYHANGDVDILFANALVGDSASYNGTASPGDAYGTCDNVSCHSDGTGAPVETPTWGTAGDCATCHASAPSTGSHTEHLGSGASCGNCHDGAIKDSSAPSEHVDGDIDVYDASSGDLGYTPDKTINTAYETCDNASCHSDGRGNLVETPTWGTSAGCGACHASAPSTGSHTGHLGYTSDISCGDCHDGAIKDSTHTGAEHTDGDIDVFDVSAGDLGYTPDKTINSAYDTCDNAICHGSISRTWNDNTTRDACTKCHGDPSAGSVATDAEIAPPNDTNGDTANTDAQVGAHQAHLTAASGISNVNGIDCNNCHTKPTNVFDSGHIDTALPAEITFGSLATLGTSGTPNYSGAPGGTCANVYCHDGRSFGKSSAAEIDFETPDWNETDLNDADAEGMCDNCHGYPPNAPHYGSDCSLCHDHVDPGDLSFTGVANRALHIDGAIRATGACNGCHEYPPYPTDGKDYQDDPVQEGKGAHLVHVGNLMNEPGYTYGALDPDNDLIDGAKVAYVCGSCHDMTNHAIGTRAINFGGSTKYRFGSSGPSYKGIPDTPGSSNFKSCTNVSCHFYESPGWQDPGAPK